MYIATADVHKTGSTPLHMDMCAAMNIMPYCSPGPGGSCGANWVIVKALDSHKLRQYLRRKHVLPTSSLDPIHRQKSFLNDDDLHALHQQGVTLWSFTQGVNDAIFIPPGTAHQVR